MDVAKAVSYFSINNVNIKECYGVNNLKNDRCPLIQIPTTAGKRFGNVDLDRMNRDDFLLELGGEFRFLKLKPHRAFS